MLPRTCPPPRQIKLPIPVPVVAICWYTIQPAPTAVFIDDLVGSTTSSGRKIFLLLACLVPSLSIRSSSRRDGSSTDADTKERSVFGVSQRAARLAVSGTWQV